MVILIASEIFAMDDILEAMHACGLHPRRIEDDTYRTHEAAFYIPGDRYIREYRLWGGDALACGMISNFSIKPMHDHGQCGLCQQMFHEGSLIQEDRETVYCRDCHRASQANIDKILTNL